MSQEIADLSGNGKGIRILDGMPVNLATALKFLQQAASLSSDSETVVTVNGQTKRLSDILSTLVSIG